MTLPEYDQKGMQNIAIGELVDCCADIRAVYSRLKARAAKEKMGEVEELAQEQDTQTLLQLEEGNGTDQPSLDLLYDTAVAMGIDTTGVEAITATILPPERQAQLIKRKSAVTI